MWIVNILLSFTLAGSDPLWVPEEHVSCLEDAISYRTLKSAYATHLPILRELLRKTSGHILELGVGHFSTAFLLYCLNQAQTTGSRNLFSLESSRAWLEKWKPSGLLESTHHKIHLVHEEESEFWDSTTAEEDKAPLAQAWLNSLFFLLRDMRTTASKVPPPAEHSMQPSFLFDVCFIDQEAVWARVTTAGLLLAYRHSCRFLLIHDADNLPSWNFGTARKHDGKAVLDFTDTCGNFRVYDPPRSYWPTSRGPPTLLCGSASDFNLINTSLHASIVVDRNTAIDLEPSMRTSLAVALTRPYRFDVYYTARPPPRDLLRVAESSNWSRPTKNVLNHD